LFQADAAGNKMCGRHESEASVGMCSVLGGVGEALSPSHGYMPRTWGVQKRGDKRLGYWADARGAAGPLFTLARRSLVYLALYLIWRWIPFNLIDDRSLNAWLSLSSSY